MAILPEPFNPDSIAPDDRSFEPVPTGNYRMQVIESKVEDTKTGSGQMLTLTLEIIDGEYQNRRIWDRLNVRNQSPDAQRIAQQSLAALCRSIGLQGQVVQDSEVLHFKPFTARVTIEQSRDAQYGPQNRVRYIDPSPKAPQGKTAPKPAPTAPTKPSTNKPWNNPKLQQQQKDMDDEIPF